MSTTEGAASPFDADKLIGRVSNFLDAGWRLVEAIRYINFKVNPDAEPDAWAHWQRNAERAVRDVASTWNELAWETTCVDDPHAGRLIPTLLTFESAFQEIAHESGFDRRPVGGAAPRACRFVRSDEPDSFGFAMPDPIKPDSMMPLVIASDAAYRRMGDALGEITQTVKPFVEGVSTATPGAQAISPSGQPARKKKHTKPGDAKILLHAVLDQLIESGPYGLNDQDILDNFTINRSTFFKLKKDSDIERKYLKYKRESRGRCPSNIKDI
jgi:hypothetical protein